MIHCFVYVYTNKNISVYVYIVKSLSRVQLFATPWSAACQASVSFTISQSVLKLIFIESVMPSNYLILCCPLLLLPSIFPSIRVFSNDLASGCQNIGTSASAPVLPKDIQGWFPLGLTGLISLLYICTNSYVVCVIHTCKMVWSLWKRNWQFLIKWNTKFIKWHRNPTPR